MNTDPMDNGTRRAAVNQLLLSGRTIVNQLHALLDAAQHVVDSTPMEPPPGLPDLTDTERMVWQRIADPKDEKYATIYHDLGMSKRTFDKHVCNLFRKLGVHKRAGAVRVWAEHGPGRTKR